MIKRKNIIGRTGFVLMGIGCLITVLLSSAAHGLDPKHNAPISCDNCHVAHSSLGGGMTNAKENAALCLSCHTSAGMGGKKPFVDNMKPKLVGSSLTGTTHAWDVPVVNAEHGTSYPTNPDVFLRLDPIIKGMVGNTSTTDKKSVNNVNLEAVKTNNELVDKVIQFYAFKVELSGKASSGTTSTVSDSSRTWGINNYVKYYVKMTSGANKGKARAISSNTADTLALLDPFSSPVAAGDAYDLVVPSYANSGIIRKVTGNSIKSATANDRIEFDEFPEAPREEEKFAIMGTDAKFGCSACHNQHLQKNEPWTPGSSPYVAYDADPAKASNNRKFMRIDNDRSQLCLECHSSRAQASAINTRVWDGGKKSHPIGKVFVTDADKGLVPDVTIPSEFNSKPLDAIHGGVSKEQTGSDKRYSGNGSNDTNLTNNIMLDSDGRVACLSCHGIHYTDSKADTEDKP